MFLGLEWGLESDVRLRFGRISEDVSFTVPLPRSFEYCVPEPDKRFCCGWFDSSAPEGMAHRVCKYWRLAPSGQCASCRAMEGFTPLYGAGTDPAKLPAVVRDYALQPHWLYVAMFADGTGKIGTAAESRRGVRLVEQGAIAARYIARARDGLSARQAERVLAHQLGLAQAVRQRRKLKSLGTHVTSDAIDRRLENLMDSRWDEIVATLRKSTVEPLEKPEAWMSPESTKEILERTPIPVAEVPLNSGVHRVSVAGVLGSIIIYSEGVCLQQQSLIPIEQLLCQSLEPLRGREIDACISMQGDNFG